MRHASTAAFVAILAASAGAGASLDKDLIRGRVRAHNAEFRACYDKALKKDPKLEGKVIAKFVVAKDGTVVESEASGMPAVDGCIAGVIKTIRFPANSRGSFTVNYPFAFTVDSRR